MKAERALFIPLKAKFFAQFATGEKDTEYRVHGPRWNATTCRVGRKVVLSCGYGRGLRLQARIVSIHFDNLPAVNVPGWADCYGHAAGQAIGIRMELIK